MAMPSADHGSPSVVVDAIRRHFGALTEAQRELADYVIGNRDTVAFLSAKELGDAAGVSDAAVVRFAQALGYQGFLEMRSMLREELLQRAGSAELVYRQAAAAREWSSGPAQSFDLDRHLITATEQLNDPAVYGRIAAQMVAARRIWIVGHGTSYPLAAHFAAVLRAGMDNVRVLTVGTGDLGSELRMLGPEDMMLGIGYVRYLPYTVDLMALARRRGCAVAAITDKMASPLTELADHVLLVARDGLSFVQSQIGTLAIMHVLVAEISSRAHDGIRARLSQTDELLEALGTWTASGGRKASGRNGGERQARQGAPVGIQGSAGKRTS